MYFFEDCLVWLRSAMEHRMGAYNVSFLEETNMHDMTITMSAVPAYALPKKFTVGDIVTLGDMCGRYTYQRTVAIRIFKKNLDEKYKIIDVEYANFPRWQFWNKNKYPFAYWVERVNDVL